MNKTTVVVTSVSEKCPALVEVSLGCKENGWSLYVIGDGWSKKGEGIPEDDFFDLDRQIRSGFKTAVRCPVKNYARKNVGYLLAWRDGVETIVETDDDNFPSDSFWNERVRGGWSLVLPHKGWANVYALFTDAKIWPRGLPLDQISLEELRTISIGNIDSPIQQSLVNGDPDVDAIYRMLFPGTFSFDPERRSPIALDYGAWCPFNSQNTTWWRDAFPLLYLPAYCSFRMCDIWRSFVAQRIAVENGWRISFHPPTMIQERNPHDLMDDFSLEVDGYLNNDSMINALWNQELKAGVAHIWDNLRVCYERLVDEGWMDEREMKLVEAWISDGKGIPLLVGNSQ